MFGIDALDVVEKLIIINMLFCYPKSIMNSTIPQNTSYLDYQYQRRA